LLHCDIGVTLSAGPKRRGYCCSWVLRKTLLCFEATCDWNRWVFECYFSVVVGSRLREAWSLVSFAGGQWLGEKKDGL
jgi:hypothetical protein